MAREFATVEALWQNQRPLWLQDSPPEPAQALAAAGTFVDAIDALVLAIEKQFGVKIGSSEESRRALASVSALAAYLRSRPTGP